MATKRNIRHHRKSKSGCLECRERRIKCDEDKPICRNCVRRSSQCTYLPAAAPRSSSSRSRLSSYNRSASNTSTSGSPNNYNVQEQSQQLTQIHTERGVQSFKSMETHTIASSIGSAVGALNLMHMELLHHWYTSASLTITRSPELAALWKTDVPRIGLSHGYVLQAMLALSARHLSRVKPDKKDVYESVAIALKAAALGSVAKILPNITEQNCSAVFIFSGLTWMNCMAAPEKPDEIPPLSQTDTTADWLVLLRGILTIVNSGWPWLITGDVGPLLRLSMGQYQPTGAVSTAEDHLVQLKQLIENSDCDRRTAETCLIAVEGLQDAFFAFCSRPRDACILPIIFGWAVVVSDDFVSLLGERKPEALVTFSFFAALMSKGESCWWLEGWAEHLISRIYRMLSPYHRLWIQWPMEEIGFVPSRSSFAPNEFENYSV